MATEIAIKTEMAEAAELMFFPQWLNTRLAMVAAQNRDMPLPASHFLNLAQETWIKRKISALSDAITETPNDERVINLLGEFLQTYSPPGLTRDQAIARGRAYASALSDLPVWCLAEAISRWHKGELISEANLSWPIPATLRQAALDVRAGAQGRLIVLKRMLVQDSEGKLLEDSRARMKAKADELVTQTVESVRA